MMRPIHTLHQIIPVPLAGVPRTGMPNSLGLWSSYRPVAGVGIALLLRAAQDRTK